MRLLDDLIPETIILDRFADSVLAHHARIELEHDRIHVLFEALRAELRSRGATKAEVKAAIADLKARIDARRKQLGTSAAAGARLPNQRRTGAADTYSSRVRVPRVAESAMAEVA